MPMQMVVAPTPIYLVRMPDDMERPEKVIMGAVLRGNHKRFSRFAWDVDTYEKWAQHPCFERPVPISLDIRENEDGSIEVGLAAMVPLRELPRAEWGAAHEGEEWKQEEPPPGALGPLRIGRIGRKRSARHHPNALSEAMCILSRAFSDPR